MTRVVILTLSLLILSLAEASPSLSNKIARTLGGAIDFAFLSKNVSYVNLNDFDVEEGRFTSITLSPGDSIKYTCGNISDRKDGTISIYPSNPVIHTLAPMQKSGILDSIQRELNHFDVYRSDRTLIHSTMDILGGSYLIQYPYSSVIASKNLEGFSLNIACVYNSPDHANGELYRWLEVKFADVMPLAYGCGSGGYNLFSNVIPRFNTRNLFDPIELSSPECEIVPEPGMILGIYCAEDEVFDEEGCYNKGVNGMLLYDPKFMFMSSKSRLHLFKVPDEGYIEDVNFTCECRSRSGALTSRLSVVTAREYVCDYKSISENMNRKSSKDQVCRRELRPGESVRIITPADGEDVIFKNAVFQSILSPFNRLSTTAYIHKLGANKLSEANLESIFASTDFKIEKVDADDRNEYLIEYGKDSILVLKAENTNLTYFWEMHSRGGSFRPLISGTISIGLIPTDPYTFGCGAKFNYLFRDERTDFQQGSDDENIATSCLLDAKVHTPIGFYCPKDAVLEPADCFVNVINSKGKIVAMSDVTKYARRVLTKNLTILDFHAPNDVIIDEHDPIEVVQCNCKNTSGNTLATIKVQIPLERRELTPNDNENDISDDELEKMLERMVV